ncbi:8-oxo-dGTP pyrophosphatase MutT (NUDIX family) [Novosphingobium sp. SG751A]|uniref:NUDIX hydrolase n=1 Tax=Novosphingobium sp. SG751A TaxID=2587000 RepID=UPI001551EA01|nr:NUDIX domain-containing protein [Novosphingobium sp. SG751A]NOW46785.1 8-oxo-dGTP pyrophosphatase MutT (NUDIX family) [Novosphingobium sp. SG751A]
MDSSPPLILRPAATLVIFRQGAAEQPPELLMVERSEAMRFAAGATVFPGGKVDPQDIGLAQSLTNEDPTDTAARIAAIRETLEETGLGLGFTRGLNYDEAVAARTILQSGGAMGDVLSRLGLALNLEVLTPFARWRRESVGGFDTRFYLANIGTGAVDLAVDTTENSRLFWQSARDSLSGAAQGALKIILPTLLNLERLAQFVDFHQAAADAKAHPIVPISARRMMRDGEEWLTIPEGLGYPITAMPLSAARRG